MQSTTRRLLLSIALTLTTALVVGCSQQVSAPTAKPAAPVATAVSAAPPTAVPAQSGKAARTGKVVFGNGADIGTSDPYFQPGGGETAYQSSVFESLMQYDFDGNIKPQLALSYTWIDPKTIEWKLRKGVKFHNGDPFTAADVKFTVERSLSPYAVKAQRTGKTKLIERVEIVDDYTIRFYLKQVLPVFPYAISSLGASDWLIIVPKNYIEKNGDEAYNQRPIATGPFKFANRVFGSSLSVTAFDDWWGPEPWDVAPTVKDLEFRYIPEAQTRVACLLSGECDVVDGVPFQMMDSVDGKQGYRVKFVNTTIVTSISVNTALQTIPETDKPSPFLDKRVRQAMRWAIDTDAIIKSTTRGYGKKSEGPWAPPGWGAHPERLTTKYTYNPEKAKQLLKEANFPSDLEFSHLVYPRDTRPGWQSSGEAADGYLRAVGMNLKTRIVENGYLLDHRRKQDVWALTVWPVMYPYQSPSRTSGLTTKDGLAAAYSIEGDKKIDEMVLAAESTTDEKARDELWFKVYEYMNENATWIPLYIQPITYGVSPRVDYKLIPSDEPPYPHRITWLPGFPK